MYAKYTNVPVEKSIEELRGALKRVGANGFSSGSSGDKVFVAFIYKSTPVKIFFSIPHAPGSDASLIEIKKYEQARRTKWRQFLLCTKAKLECVMCGLESFHEAFMPHIVLSDGSLLGIKILGDVDIMKETEAMDLFGFNHDTNEVVDEEECA